MEPQECRCLFYVAGDKGSLLSSMLCLISELKFILLEAKPRHFSIITLYSAFFTDYFAEVYLFGLREYISSFPLRVQSSLI